MTREKDMILKFEAAGQTILAGGDYDFKILTAEGFEAGDYEFTSAANAQIDGLTITGRRTAARELTVKIECKDSERGRIIAFHNPKLTGKLTATINGRTRWIPYVVKRFRFLQENLYDPLVYQLTMTCPQPYFLDMSDFGKDLAASVPLYAFPFVWLAGRDYTSDYRQFSTNFLVVNKGDVDTGMKVTFIAKGVVKNPKLYLQNGQYIRVIVDLTKGDQLSIETNKGKKSILLNGVNIINRIDRQSTFIGLATGENTLTYTADDGYMNLEVRLYYTPMYLGV